MPDQRTQRDRIRAVIIDIMGCDVIGCDVLDDNAGAVTVDEIARVVAEALSGAERDGATEHPTTARALILASIKAGCAAGEIPQHDERGAGADFEALAARIDAQLFGVNPPGYWERTASQIHDARGAKIDRIAEERDAARAELATLRATLEPLSHCMAPIPGGTGDPSGGWRCGRCVGCHLHLALRHPKGPGGG